MEFAALVSFNRVAAHGGFGQASRAIGQAKATLSRHVREIEGRLGVRLVERGSTPAVVLSGVSDKPAWRVARDGRSMVVHPRPVLRFSSFLMVRDAVRAGAGAAVLPLSLVADDLAAGRLVSSGAGGR